jgi:predicted aspartyl protease
MPGFGALLALSLVTGIAPPATGPIAPTEDGSDVVAMRADDANRMTVPVAIGNHGTYRFMVDTGAQNTIISNELAARLSLLPTTTGRVIGTAGETRVGIVRLDGLMLGSRSFDNLVVPLFKQIDIGADGVVGLDSLQHQRVLLDFRRKLMTINDADSDHDNSGFEIVVIARRRSGQLIMTDATIDGVRVDVVVDTGSDSTIGNYALAKALAHRGKGAESATLHSVTGQTIVASMGTSRELVLGPLKLSNVSIAYVDAPPFAALHLSRRPAIFLGMNELRAFRRVAIDFSRHKVLFDIGTLGFAARD